MARILPTMCAATIVSVPLLAGGCVQQDKYDNLLQVKRSLQEQLLTVTDERDSMQAQLSNRTNQLQAAREDIAVLQEKYEPNWPGRRTGVLQDILSFRVLFMISQMHITPMKYKYFCIFDRSHDSTYQYYTGFSSFFAPR